MREVDPDDSSITADPTINLVAPLHNIDIKHILMGVREELMIYPRLTFSRNIVYRRTHIIVPSLVYSFKLEWRDPYIIFTKGTTRPMKIPIEIEDGLIAESTIDIICAIVEMKRMNS